MEFLVLSALLAGSMISTFDRSYGVRKKSLLKSNVNDVFRVFVPDQVHPRHGFETTNMTKAMDIANSFPSATIKSSKDTIHVGEPTKFEKQLQSVHFQQQPYLLSLKGK